MFHGYPPCSFRYDSRPRRAFVESRAAFSGWRICVLTKLSDFRFVIGNTGFAGGAFPRYLSQEKSDRFSMPSFLNCDADSEYTGAEVLPCVFDTAACSG